jgi:hypothetical protein
MAVSYVRQQDFSTKSLRAHGCGAAAMENALRKASGGAYQSRNISSAARFRIRQAGATPAEFNARGLTSREIFASLQAVVSTDVRMDLSVKAYHGGRMTDMLAKMREVDGVLLVAVKNKVLVKAGKTQFKTFNGGHWGVVTSWDGGPNVHWIAGEKSPILLPVSLLSDAADQFGDKRDIGLADDSWGDGRGEAILVGRWRTWKSGYADMKKQRDDCMQAAELLDAALAKTQEALNRCLAEQGGNP